jgi:ATP-dependent Lhr-like helicase
VLYITPLRAVARDIELALRAPLADLGVLSRSARDRGLRVEGRTGDTGSSLRARQRERLPEVLVTTPESLSLMLTWPDARERLGGVRAVIVDEWHELLSSKRGTQTELALARLRRFNPQLRTWGLSATLDNLHDAARALAGAAEREPEIISASVDRPVFIDSVLPAGDARLPWAGHLGLAMLPAVLGAIDPAVSTLIFTNTRSQAERWHAAILAARPEWEPILGLHHGSVDRTMRERVEAGLKDGSVRLCVATSSLDLGVDFAPVERVFQVGSVKGVARTVQRAGRSGHRPGAACRVLCVPTHGLELLEIAAVRRAVAAGESEPREALRKPLDVLSQHMVTCALGGGFDANELFDEVRAAWSYRDLERAEFDWTLALVEHGGTALRAYPEYRKVVRDVASGRYGIATQRLAALHRLNVGTITSEASVSVQYVSGKRLGSIEEGFIANLDPGEVFTFAGKNLELARVRDMTALVRPAKKKPTLTPVWGGTRLPISESLGRAVRAELERVGRAIERGEESALDAESAAAVPILRAQRGMSKIPLADELLVEVMTTPEGEHVFVYPFEGRLVHSGIAAILALRLGRLKPSTFAIASNDYGFELLSARGTGAAGLLSPAAFTLEGLLDDTLASLNMSELARRQFREVARVAGLVVQNHPGQSKSSRQLQASSGLLYDVLSEFDPGNLLVEQARREVLERQFERSRLARAMERLAALASRGAMTVREVERPTPLGFPLVIERVGARLSSESILDRVEKMRAQWQTWR